MDDAGRSEVPVKGVLFNVLEDVVDETMPTDTWDLALRDAGVKGAYTSLGNYGTHELEAVIDALSRRTGIPVAELMRVAGREGYRHLSGRHPEVVARYRSIGEILGALDTVIHPEVLKLYPNAEPPRFEVVAEPDGPEDLQRWRLEYRSQRGFCHLAEGLVQGAAHSYGQEVEVTQSTCTHHGAPLCTFEVVLLDPAIATIAEQIVATTPSGADRGA